MPESPMISRVDFLNGLEFRGFPPAKMHIKVPDLEYERTPLNWGRCDLRVCDSAMINVLLSGVTAIPFGKAIPSATCRMEQSEVTSAIIPGPPLI